jgi:hypothetical protein
MAKSLENMKTSKVREKARQAGIKNVGQMTKEELINAMGGGFNTERGGGQRQKDPKPKGMDPSEFKNVPGNQT